MLWAERGVHHSEKTEDIEGIAAAVGTEKPKKEIEAKYSVFGAKGLGRSRVCNPGMEYCSRLARTVAPHCNSSRRRRSLRFDPSRHGRLTDSRPPQRKYRGYDVCRTTNTEYCLIFSSFYSFPECGRRFTRQKPCPKYISAMSFGIDMVMARFFAH